MRGIRRALGLAFGEAVLRLKCEVDRALDAADVVFSTGLHCQTLRVQPHPNLPASKSECAGEWVLPAAALAATPRSVPRAWRRKGTQRIWTEELRGTRMQFTTLLARCGYRGCVNALRRNSWQEALTVHACDGTQPELARVNSLESDRTPRGDLRC